MPEETKNEETSEQKPAEIAQPAQVTTETQVPVEDIKHLDAIKDILYGKKGEEVVPPVVDTTSETADKKVEEQNPDASKPPVSDEKKSKTTVDDDNSNGAPEFSPVLLVRAKASGVSDKMLALLKTPDALKEFCDELDKGKRPEDKKAEPSQLDEKLEKLKEDLDPSVVDILDEIRKEYKAKIDAIESKFAETEKQSADRKKNEEKAEQERNTQWFDTKFHTVSEQHPEIGKGNFVAVVKDKDAMKVRNKIANRMELLKLEYHANDEPIPGKAELFDKAVQDVLGQPKNAKKTDETRQKLEKQQFTYPPSHSESAKPPKSDDEQQAELDNMITGMLDKIRRR